MECKNISSNFTLQTQAKIKIKKNKKNTNLLKKTFTMRYVLLVIC